MVSKEERTENRIMYPPTFVRTEKACSMAESNKRKENVKDEGEFFGAFREMFWEDIRSRGRVSIAARTEERTTIKRM